MERAEGARLNGRRLGRGWGLKDSDRKGQSSEQQGKGKKLEARSARVEGAGAGSALQEVELSESFRVLPRLRQPGLAD